MCTFARILSRITATKYLLYIEFIYSIAVATLQYNFEWGKPVTLNGSIEQQIKKLSHTFPLLFADAVGSSQD